MSKAETQSAPWRKALAGLWTETVILRLVMAVILVMHSVPGMLDGGVRAFGTMYLDQVGFAPLGLPIAWAVKLSHLACVVSLLTDRLLKVTGGLTIATLVVGIVMVHGPEGWYVVGGGRNGAEFNVLLIAVLLTIMFSERLARLRV
jgi:putative oxidoreductase